VASKAAAVPSRAPNCTARHRSASESRNAIEPRIKRSPPWLRPIVVDGEGKRVPDGIVGAIRHVDLANRGSVMAIETEDLGAGLDGGIVLLGREAGAELRGCSLDAEALLRERG
jgi:hypothetical protein